MEKSNEPCGCTGRQVNSPSLRNLIDMLDRAEAKRKAQEKQAMLAALSRHALAEKNDE